MKTILVGEIHSDAKNLLLEHCDVTVMDTEKFCSLNVREDIEAVVLRTFTPCGKEEISRLPNLKYVVLCSVGMDNLDLQELKERDIELIHVPGTNANSVAEHTLYFMLSLLREDSVRPFAELKGKTIGIVGLGAIGKIVARKLKGFECRVIAFDVIEQDPAVLEELCVTMKSMDDVLKESDVVTIHVPLNKHTMHLINEEKFSLMKEKSFFINTSREEVIDETALLEVQEKFRGVALDVYSQDLKEKLQRNVILTDHIGAQGEESFRQQCLQPVRKYIDKIKQT